MEAEQYWITQEPVGMDYIVVTVESDSDDNSNHGHSEVMLLQESASEALSDGHTMGTSSDESAVIQADFQDYDHQQQFQLASGEGTSQDDQAVPQVNLETLKRPNINFVDVPQTKRGRQSTELEDKMALLQLIERLNGQVNQLFGMVSKIHQFWEKSQVQKCGHCCRLLQDEIMEIDEPDRTTETSFQSVSCYEQQQEQQEQQLVLSQDLFLPRIISTSSLTSEGSGTDVPIVSDILDEAESSNIVISDAQPTMAAPATFLLPQDPSFANNHNFIKYSAVVENEDTALLDPDFPCLLVPPSYEMPENEETNIPDDTVLVNVPNFEEDEEQSTNLLNVFINEDDMTAVAEASQANNMEPMDFPVVNENDQDSFSADTLSSQSDFERVILIEMPGQTDVNGQTLYYPALHFNGPDSEMAPASAALHSGVQGIAEASLDYNPEGMNFPPVIENDIDTLPSDSDTEDTIVIEISEDAEISGQVIDYPGVLGHFSESDSENVSNSESTNFRFEEVVLGMPGEIQVDGQTVYYPTFLGHKAVTYSETASASSDIGFGGQGMFLPLAAASANSPDSQYCMRHMVLASVKYESCGLPLKPAGGMGKGSGQFVPLKCGVPSCEGEGMVQVKLYIEKVILIKMPETVKVNDQIVAYPGILGRIITSDSETASASESANVGVEKVILEEILFDPKTMDQDNSDIMDNPPEIGNDSDYDNDEEDNESPFFSIPLFFDDQELIPVRVNCPVSMENDTGQDNIPEFPLITGFAYLGDPRRNIRVHNTHLETVEKMTKLSLAACYLVYVVFSEESLINSSASINGLGYPDLDPNRMAAIRGHLGHSSRRVHVPCSVMTIAKTKRSPELSARYLSHYLFTEELSRNTIFDNMQFDVCNLDDNTIAAIRGLLHAFPNQPRI
ncbi:PREDICTED: BEN domain-containing protein 2 [Dipodomys ordii]|uniref:BEN domain-containing protein 2 n=1 Tax=Dipodomys ordii TaxID=10020 RepID=A0A1S3GH62_DIPOR|nr:PREDICTED: BEN domain-containing protein 2 [Dipodomys ordii]